MSDKPELKSGVKVVEDGREPSQQVKMIDNRMKTGSDFRAKGKTF